MGIGVIDVDRVEVARSEQRSLKTALSTAQQRKLAIQLTVHSSRLTSHAARHATRVAFLARCTRADAVSPRRSVTSVISGDAPSRNGIPQ